MKYQKEQESIKTRGLKVVKYLDRGFDIVMPYFSESLSLKDHKNWICIKMIYMFLLPRKFKIYKKTQVLNHFGPYYGPRAGAQPMHKELKEGQRATQNSSILISPEDLGSLQPPSINRSLN